MVLVSPIGELVATYDAPCHRGVILVGGIQFGVPHTPAAHRVRAVERPIFGWAGRSARQNLRTVAFGSNRRRLVALANMRSGPSNAFDVSESVQKLCKVDCHSFASSSTRLTTDAPRRVLSERPLRHQELYRVFRNGIGGVRP